MPNIKNIIYSHNYKILRSNDTKKTCNCRDKITCPFNGEYFYKGVYKATVINGNDTREYYGSTGVSFKKRYTQHKHSFKSGNSQHTTLSKYVRKNISNNIEIILSIINKVFNMTPKSPKCAQYET